MAPSSSRFHHFLLLLLLLLLSSPRLSVQSTYQNISIGTTLYPSTEPTSWLSPSGDFAFGFISLPTNTSLFLLAIWFDKLANKTVVWCANGGNPVAAGGSKAVLESNGQFSLLDPSGQEIWKQPDGVNKASHAAILDTGNLVFSAADSTVLWQSFDYPTDTILPGQALKQNTELFAKITDTDFTPGRFKLSWQGDGNLVLYAVAFPTTFQYDPYWALGTNVTGIKLVYSESGSIYLAYSDNSVHPVINGSISSDTYYQRATLDPDGIFRQYSFPKEEPKTGSWMANQTVASDICNIVNGSSGGSGACGFNSYCTYDSQGMAECECPPNYSFLDPNKKYQGCKPDFIAQSCEPGGEKSFDFVTVTNLDWPFTDAEELSPMNETECKDNCLKDCFCSVAIYKTGTCWKKKYPLSNGRMGSNIDRDALVKFSSVNSSVPFPPGEIEQGKSNWRTWTVVAAALLASSAVLNLVQISALLYKRNRRTVLKASSCMLGPSLCSFTYKQLEEATNNFSEELGKGAFGTVYKGVLELESRIFVAVKRLESKLEMEEEAEKDFMNEVQTIGQTHHKNLVRLIGFCKEGTHRLLVLEFMENGTLNKFLFRSDPPIWNERIQIAVGIARGLAYLHEECMTQIIHCDIKPQNILLDHNFVARISDFGLAKLLRLEQTRTSTGVRGTIGYFAPEWFKNSAITAKVDVYSYGVMLLEIICCRRNLEWGYGLGSEVKIVLTDQAKECYQNGRLDILIEEDEEAKNDGVRLERFVMVALSCIQEEPWLRPSMKKVVQMLEGTIEVAILADM